jgi:hypothetical protein
MGEEEKALYSVAVLVTKPPPQFRASTDPATGKITYRWQPNVGELLNTTFSPEYALTADCAFAESEAEAVEICLARARVSHPESEGWVDHVAGVCRIMSLFQIASMLTGVCGQKMLTPTERQIVELIDSQENALLPGDEPDEEEQPVM